ncbi:hypothetical protein [Rossellomorea aquimaris]|uniref:Uncharacterized protein n=1 Tax=Rossellomorea aquimaris TaxID=189382 RepID=A0A5D4U770_9BACI|nr:hypothetical protein [Rossellomorea aquimaris]TYS76438.1 hypothetical protein FZD05_17565 [Rossellomorea aquimaris]TYS83028.1 hypothetical protein FZC85_18165 [Rossellomorea aquimaris]
MGHTTYVKNGVVDHNVFRKRKQMSAKHGDGSGASILLFGSRRTVPLLPFASLCFPASRDLLTST